MLPSARLPTLAAHLCRCRVRRPSPAPRFSSSSRRDTLPLTPLADAPTARRRPTYVAGQILLRPRLVSMKRFMGVIFGGDLATSQRGDWEAGGQAGKRRGCGDGGSRGRRVVVVVGGLTVRAGIPVEGTSYNIR
jgi:hypothetical protein